MRLDNDIMGTKREKKDCATKGICFFYRRVSYFSLEQDYCTIANHVFFHSLIVLSSLPLASVCPSALMATLSTKSLCPVRVRRRSPVFRFHSLIVSSQLPLLRVCPSGLMATLLTRSEER